jgi:N-acyl-D-aspartate/D-glutamate deacylase
VGGNKKGVFQIISDFTDMEEEMARIQRIMERSRVPTSISVLQSNKNREKWREVMKWIERCNAQGIQVRAQVCGRPVGLLLAFDFSRNPFYMCPTFRKLKQLPREERRRALAQPDVRAKILAEEPEKDDALGAALPRMWSIMYELGEDPDYEPTADQSIAERAKRMGVTPEELAYDICMKNDQLGVLWCPVSNYTDNTLDEAGAMLQHPYSLYGLGDGGAHLGFLCDASLPTYMLQYWARDRKRGKIALPDVVKNLTQNNARAIGLNDRGALKAGLRADINVIDFDKLRLGPPRASYDLPANGARVTQHSRGYVATLVAGIMTQRDDKPTGALPGKLVRGAR